MSNSNIVYSTRDDAPTSIRFWNSTEVRLNVTYPKPRPQSILIHRISTHYENSIVHFFDLCRIQFLEANKCLISNRIDILAQILCDPTSCTRTCSQVI
ncbi:hypothetical protein KC19_VG072400 [Ceratodon purpureus]|uniref:Uncharacterized protein n=1 Tax=Ceratodon purpureus TaxID=3225 RepID=A0A8T0HMZ1_CERPU|nr:hypothetical protein KC19_VG072400 [Ceratodon purpureus]